MSDAWDVFVLCLDKFALERERGPVKSPVNERFGTAKHRDMVADHFIMANRFRAAILALTPPAEIDETLLVKSRPARKAAVAKVARVVRPRAVPATPPRPERGIAAARKAVPIPEYIAEEIFTDREFEIAIAAMANKRSGGVFKWVA